MWNSVIMALGAATLTGCQPSGEPSVRVTQVSPGIHKMALESEHRIWPYIELHEAGSLVVRHEELAPQLSANVCKGAYSLERTEAWVSQCDFVCNDPRPYTVQTTWLVSCKSASE